MANRDHSQRSARRSVPGQVVMGIATIAFGLLFLLDNLDILDFHRVFSFWPTAFILIGAFKLWDTQSPNGRAFGVIMIAVGMTLTLNRLGYIHFNIRDMWPLILIAIGAGILLRQGAWKR